MAVDRVSAIMGVQVENAASPVQLFKNDPNHAMFSKLMEEKRAEMHIAVALSAFQKVRKAAGDIS